MDTMAELLPTALADTMKGITGIVSTEIIANNIHPTADEIQTIVTIIVQVVVGIVTIISIVKNWFKKT